MITFGHPFALLWVLLAVPIVIVYLRAVRLRRVPVATGMIWQQVFAPQRTRAAWRRWRDRVSLGVQLIVLLLLVAAMLGPQIPAPRRLVLIIDNSASMSATEAGATRLAAAREAARAVIAGLRDCDSAAVLSTGGAAAVQCSFTGDAARLGQAVDSLPETHATARIDAAVGLARRMLSGELAGRIVVISDGCFRGAGELAAWDDVELVRVGSRSDNLAVTRLRARQTAADPSRHEVLAEVVNFSDTPAQCRLELLLDGKPLKTVPIELAGNGEYREFFTVASSGPGRLVARLDRSDDYVRDNRISVRTSGWDESAWEVADDVQRFAAEGDARRESDLRPPGDAGTEASAMVVQRPGPPSRAWPAGVVVLLLVLQWGFYQRRWLT